MGTEAGIGLVTACEADGQVVMTYLMKGMPAGI